MDLSNQDRHEVEVAPPMNDQPQEDAQEHHIVEVHELGDAGDVEQELPAEPEVHDADPPADAEPAAPAAAPEAAQAEAAVNQDDIEAPADDVAEAAEQPAQPADEITEKSGINVCLIVTISTVVVLLIGLFFLNRAINTLSPGVAEDGILYKLKKFRDTVNKKLCCRKDVEFDNIKDMETQYDHYDVSTTDADEPSPIRDVGHAAKGRETKQMTATRTGGYWNDWTPPEAPTPAAAGDSDSEHERNILLGL